MPVLAVLDEPDGPLVVHVEVVDDLPERPDELPAVRCEDRPESGRRGRLRRATARCAGHSGGRGTGLSARERSRQPEPWEDAVIEAGHGADPLAGEGEHVEAGPLADAGRAA